MYKIRDGKLSHADGKREIASLHSVTVAPLGRSVSMRGMRRWISRLVFVVIVLAATAGASVALAESRSQKQLQSNKVQARADAAALVAGVQLPPGATPSSIEPAGDNGLLPFSSEAIEGDAAHALAHGWWIVDEPADQVLDYVSSHAPRGMKRDGSGYSNGPRGSTESDMFEAPAIPGKLGERMMWVTVATLQDGQTGVAAEAQSDYIVPRPSSERVPVGASVLTITRTRNTITRSVTTGRLTHLTTTHLATVQITRRATIRRVTRLIDSLPVAQPDTIYCPALMFPTTTYTLTWRRAAASRPLARVQFVEYHDAVQAVGSQCDTIGFSIGGHRRDALIGTRVVARLRAAAGGRL
jgi:hypothetical protein